MAHEETLAALARSARAAILVPVLFALALLAIKQPQMAGFAVFGTFAHQVLVTYDTAGTARFAQAAMLTLLGAVAISLGTFLSQDDWLAVAGAFGVGVLSELPLLASGRIAKLRGALLLSFMLALAVPAPIRAVFPSLAGWLAAGAMAQPALLLIWSTATGGSACSCGRTRNFVARSNHLNAVANGARVGLALGLAVLLTRLFKVEHAFWVFLGVLPVLNARRGFAARTFWEEQRGTFIGCLVGAVVVAIIGTDHVWYWLILPFIVFGSVYAASALGLMVLQAAFTLFAVVLVGILSPQHTYSGIIRLEDIALGGAVSFAVSALLRLGVHIQTA